LFFKIFKSEKFLNKFLRNLRERRGGMNKNHLKKNGVVTIEKTKEVMEDLIKKRRFFGGYCLGVPQKSKEKLSLPLCNKETGELRFWFKSAS